MLLLFGFLLDSVFGLQIGNLMTMTNFESMRQRLEGIAGILSEPKSNLSFANLQKSQWSDQFETLMRNRMIMGGIRYGSLSKQRTEKKRKFDDFRTLKAKIELYEKTRNKELLVDSANYLMIIFELDNHPLAHFNATDDKHHSYTK